MKFLFKIVLMALTVFISKAQSETKSLDEINSKIKETEAKLNALENLKNNKTSTTQI